MNCRWSKHINNNFICIKTKDKCNFECPDEKKCFFLYGYGPLKKDISEKDSEVEIRLYNHKTNKVFYKNLNLGELLQIAEILKLRDKEWD